MPQQLESACMVIADISGYTSYLVGVELDHAQDILADLMNTVVGALRPPFKLSKLEGDAAFVYVPTEKVDATAILDSVEGTYFAFRRRLRNIRLSSRCVCNACRALPQLDLKFVVHHGEIARHRVAGREELAGREVILIHRLLKNNVDQLFGARPYALITEACMRAMEGNPVALGLKRHSETIDLIGEVEVWLLDLDAAWRAAEGRSSHEVMPEGAFATRTFEIKAPPAIVWAVLTSPDYQPLWMGAESVVAESASGRRGPGTINHCLHGRDAIIQEVLDWRPNELLTTRSEMPMPGAPKIIMTDRLSPIGGGGTRVDVRLAKPKPRDRGKFEEMSEHLIGMIMEAGGKLRQVSEGLMVAAPAAPEPALPRSAGRFASEPVLEGGPEPVVH